MRSIGSMSARLIIAGLCVVSSVLMSCAAPPPSIKTPFNPQEVAWADGSGASRIIGQAFYRRGFTQGLNDNQLVNYTCAADLVRLMPYAAFTLEESDILMLPVSKFYTSKPIEAEPYKARAAICDGQGNFEFASLPAGKWIVMASIPERAITGDKMLGNSVVRIREIITTDGHGVTKVILAKNLE